MIKEIEMRRSIRKYTDKPNNSSTAIYAFTVIISSSSCLSLFFQYNSLSIPPLFEYHIEEAINSEISSDIKLYCFNVS